MNVRDPKDLTDAVSTLSANFGVSVNYTRFVESATPNRSVFGSDLAGTTETLTATIIIEDIKRDMLPTIAGQRPKETLLFLAPGGSFKNGDTVQYSGHNYLVTEVFPIQYVGQEISDEVQATREVD